MKEKYWRSESDRTALTIILICMAILTAGCILGIIYLTEYGFYKEGDNGKTAKSIAVQIYSLEDIEQVEDYYNCRFENNDDIRVEYYRERFSTKTSNFIFSVVDAYGNRIFTNSDATTEHLMTDARYKGSAGFHIIGEDGKVEPMRIDYAINDGEGSAKDKYSSAFSWIDIANTLRYALFAFAFLAIIIIVVILSVLTVHAGMNEDGEITPGFIDKIPLDVWVFFLGLVLFVCWVVMGLTAAGNVGMVLNNVIIMIAFAVLVVVLQLFLSTLSVRVKIGKIHRSTLVYFIFRRFTGRMPIKIRRAFREMSMFKKLILGITAYIIGEAVIMLSATYFVYVSDFADTKTVFTVFLAFWGITTLIMVPVFAMIAINLHYVKEEGKRLASGVLGDEISSKLTVSAIRAHGQNLDLIRKEITKAMEQEIRSERLKSELITNVSHDLKTPLTSIINYTELLKADALTDEQRKEYLSILSNHTDRLAILLNDLIEASRITSGNIEINLEKTSLNIILAQTVDEYAYKLEQAEILPRIEMPEEDIYIMGDGKWLWRTLSNLMSNACKYAEKGTDVKLTLKKSGKKAVVTIQNSYNAQLNIDSSELTERFVRGDGSRHTEGNGLGLPIAKSLTELQKGKLTLSAENNIFCVKLEFDAVE